MQAYPYENIIASVDEYYSGTLRLHGAVPLGVDWPSIASQYLRFVQLLKICETDSSFSLNDFGCGYGGLLAFMDEWRPHNQFTYYGIDVSSAMIDAARKLWKDRENTTFCLGSRSLQIADFTIASGVFNIRLEHSVEEWEHYVEDTLRGIAATSSKGFSLNFMLPLGGSVGEKDIYRTIPDRWAWFCRHTLNRATEIVTNYGLREFTLLVRHR